MKPFSGYNETKSYSDAKQLPKGAYVLRIMNAQEEHSATGDYIMISCDIEEGEYKGFFTQDYKDQDREDKKWHCNYILNEPKDDGSEKDGWTKRRFKTVTEALEESNAGYHWDWDEKKWKGKLIGGLFNTKQFKGSDGQIREATNLKQLCAVEKIRSGKYKMPKDDLLKQEEVAPKITADDEFMQVPDVELPWG